jgi:hypothetical protein
VRRLHLSEEHQLHPLVVLNESFTSTLYWDFADKNQRKYLEPVGEVQQNAPHSSSVYLLKNLVNRFIDALKLRRNTQV